MKVLQKETYLAMINNAVGAKLFQTVFVKDQNVIRDVLQKGELSCAFFVSSILQHFKLIGAPHATVSSTLKDMEERGWEKTDELRVGAIILWEEQAQAGDEPHKHVGFYIGNDQTISNSYREQVPVKHHLTFNGARKIEAMYTHKFLA